MKRKRITAILLAALFALSSGLGSFVPFVSDAKEVEPTELTQSESQHGYYFEQLSDKEKTCYQAIADMYAQGIFKTGNGSYDLADNSYVTQDEIKAYLNGNMDLPDAVGAARDAFLADHPEIFYVDFNRFTMRITTGNDGKYHANLGSGRNGDYYVQGFSSVQDVDAAIATFNSKVDAIVQGAKAITEPATSTIAENPASPGEYPTDFVETTLSVNARRVQYVHDELINHTSYRLEDACQPQNVGHVRTAYGALIKGESVCEGYAEALKVVLDKLGIPCILVSGIYRHSETVSELHMWNYVQVDGEWYAVDATMDDPYREDLTTDAGKDGSENTDYLLVGQDVMSRNHAISGILSSSNREFQYPQLAIASIPLYRVSTGKDLVVDLKQTEFEGEPAGEYHVSYKGMGYAKAAQTGHYMIAKMYLYYENTDEMIYNDWAYITPGIYNGMKDTDTELILPLPQCQFAEFAVTDRAPGDYKNNLDLLYYQGDPLLLEEDTGMIRNPYASYVAPPYIQTITPGLSSRMYIGSTYPIKAVYDDKLELAEGAKEAGYRIEVPTEGSTGQEYCKLENFEWDGDRTITFDFTPSEMWADDCVAYNIHLTGLVGERSKKVPNYIHYFASHSCAVCAYRSQGYDWNVFGKPSLLENSDLSMQYWVTSDGTQIADSLKHRMALVVTSPTNRQTDAMNEMVADKFPNEEVLKSETYNINLTVCKKQVIQTGQGVRVSVGFPPGYGPGDEGVTFKAYHFKKNDAGEIIDVEEIPCIVTKYGLLVTCTSFSPFTIAAVKDDGTQTTAEKTVILSDTPGGTITGAGSIFTLTEGQSKQLTIKAEEGYALEEVVVAGKVQKITDPKSMALSLSYADLAEGANIVDAKFVASSVLEQEESRGEGVALPTAVPATIQLGSYKQDVKEGDPIQIEATVTSSGILSYQWYKDGVALPGATATTLKITAASSQDAGNYRLDVTTTVGATNALASSNACAVSVVPSKPTVALQGTVAIHSNSDTPNVSHPGNTLTATVTGSNHTGTLSYQWYANQIAIEGAVHSFYTLTDAEIGKTLSVKVSSNVETGQLSATYGGKIEALTAKASTASLKKVTSLKLVSATTKSVKLKWKKVTGANGYQIYRYNPSKKKFVKIKTTSSTSYIDKKKTEGTAYRYKVRAYRKSSSGNEYGAFSKEMKVITKPNAPTKQTAKRTSEGTVQMSFYSKHGKAAEYLIQKYNSKSEEFTNAFRVKKGKLYRYNSKSKKWKYVSKAKITKKGKVTITLADQENTKLKYRIRASIAKSGYKTGTSTFCKTLTVKAATEDIQ